MYKVCVNGRWVEVSETIFRSWDGDRKLNDKLYAGPVFYLLSNDIYRAFR